MAMIYKLVSFTPDQLRGLKREAKNQKMPVTELIRVRLFGFSGLSKAKSKLLK